MPSGSTAMRVAPVGTPVVGPSPSRLPDASPAPFHFRAADARRPSFHGDAPPEIVRDVGDLDPATAGIARELSQQYYLGYPSPSEQDGGWHAIRVEVRNSAYRVRARRGYTASP